MKKITYLGLMLVAIFTLTNCIEEIGVDTPKEPKGNFTITLSTDTKTTNDGVHTNWAAGDAVSVFHAAAGTTDYLNAGEFTLVTPATGEFTGNLGGALADNNDWYFLYPYTSTVTSPAGTSGAVTIGSAVGGVQTQNGNNSTAHLAGPMFPLVGKVTGVAKATPPSGTMSQVASVIKVNVTNTAATDLTVKSVEFVAPVDVVGAYLVDFSGATVSCTSAAAELVSNTAKLTVAGGAAITNSNSATFYLGIKPFTATSGQKIKVVVNGYEKEITLGAGGATFTAGKIKTVNFDFNQSSSVPTNLFIQGTGAETADAPFTPIAPGVFVLHQKLKSGDINFSSATGAGGTKYYSSGTSLRLGTGTHTVTDVTNVTRTIVNFNDYTVTYVKVAPQVHMMMCFDHFYSLSPVVTLTYKNNGVFEGYGNLLLIRSTNPGYVSTQGAKPGLWWNTEEDRYHFVATINDTYKCWGKTSTYNDRPNGGQPDNYYNIGEFDFTDYWQNDWKLATALDKTYSKVTINTNTYTHSIEYQSAAQIPTSLTIHGGGVEAGIEGRTMIKLGDETFVTCTKTNGGPVSFQGSDGNTYYAAPETNYLVKGTGTTTTVSSGDDPVAIYVNFMTRKVYFKKITSLRLLWSLKTTTFEYTSDFPDGAWYYYVHLTPHKEVPASVNAVPPMAYQGNGEWLSSSASVEWPVNGQVYYWVYFDDGTVKKWGRKDPIDAYAADNHWDIQEYYIGGYEGNEAWWISGKVTSFGDPGTVKLDTYFDRGGERVMTSIVTSP